MPLRCFSLRSDVFPLAPTFSPTLRRFRQRADVLHSSNASETFGTLRTFSHHLRIISTSFPRLSVWLFISLFSSICYLPFSHVPISCPSYLLGIYSCTQLVASQFEYRIRPNIVPTPRNVFLGTS